MIAQARSTRTGTATAASAAAGATGPRARPIATTATSETAHTTARVRRRRVQASAEVRPFNESPAGPTTIPIATTSPARVHQQEMTRAATTKTATAPLTGVARHQRTANRDTEPAR